MIVISTFIIFKFHHSKRYGHDEAQVEVRSVFLFSCDNSWPRNLAASWYSRIYCSVNSEVLMGSYGLVSTQFVFLIRKV